MKKNRKTKKTNRRESLSDLLLSDDHHPPYHSAFGDSGCLYEKYECVIEMNEKPNNEEYHVSEKKIKRWNIRTLFLSHTQTHTVPVSPSPLRHFTVFCVVLLCSFLHIRIRLFFVRLFFVFVFFSIAPQCRRFQNSKQNFTRRK